MYLHQTPDISVADQMLELQNSSDMARLVVASWNRGQCHNAAKDAEYVKTNFAKEERIRWWFNNTVKCLVVLYIAIAAIVAFLMRNIYPWMIVAIVELIVLMLINMIFNLDDCGGYILTPDKWQHWNKDYELIVVKLERAYYVCNQIVKKYKSLDEIDGSIRSLVLEIVKIEKAFNQDEMPDSASIKLERLRALLHEHTNVLKWTSLGYGDLKPYFQWAEQEWLKLAVRGEIVTNYEI